MKYDIFMIGKCNINTTLQNVLSSININVYRKFNNIRNVN